MKLVYLSTVFLMTIVFAPAYAIPTYSDSTYNTEGNFAKCDDNKTEFIKFSYTPNINCVYHDTAQKLEQRGWGLEPEKMYERNNTILEDNLEMLDGYLLGTEYQTNGICYDDFVDKYIRENPDNIDYNVNLATPIDFKTSKVSDHNANMFIPLMYLKSTHTNHDGVFTAPEEEIYNNATRMLIDFFKQSDIIVPISTDIQYPNHWNFIGCPRDDSCAFPDYERPLYSGGYHLGCHSFQEIEGYKVAVTSGEPGYEPWIKCETEEEQKSSTCKYREEHGVKYYCDDGEPYHKCVFIKLPE